MTTNRKVVFFLLMLSLLCVAETDQDKVFVGHKKNLDSYGDTLYFDILYYRTNGTLRKIYEFGTEDASDLTYDFRYNNDNLDYDCLYYYNNSSDCLYFIFLDRKTKTFYITKHGANMLDVEKRSVSFEYGTVVLYSWTFDDHNKVISNVKNTKIEDKTKTSLKKGGVLYGDEIKGRVLIKLLLFTEKYKFYD